MFPTVSIEHYKPLNRWMDYESIRPGVQGTVGDIQTQVRFRNSNAEMPIRWDRAFSGKNQLRMGANIVDGDQKNYFGNGPARTFHGEFLNKDRITPNGWSVKEVIPPARDIMPALNAVPGYSWRSKVAQTYNAVVPGTKFLPLPGEFALPPGELPRGPTLQSTPLSSNESTNDLLRNLTQTLTPKSPDKGKGMLPPIGYEQGQRSFGLMSRK